MNNETSCHFLKSNLLCKTIFCVFMAAAIFSVGLPVQAMEESTKIAKEIENPLAKLVQLPIFLDYNEDIGANEGTSWTWNIQPVIPFVLSNDWVLISRATLPIVTQNDVFGDSGRQTGTSDTLLNLYFSPNDPPEDGWLWGVGPAFLLRTGSKDELSTEKWGAGPNLAVVRHKKRWIYGFQAEQIWSFSGDKDRSDISTIGLRPFVAHAFPSAFTLRLTTESSYNWVSGNWSVPVIVLASKVVKVSDYRFNVGVGVRYWAESPEEFAQGWGGRFFINLPFKIVPGEK